MVRKYCGITTVEFAGLIKDLNNEVDFWDRRCFDVELKTILYESPYYHLVYEIKKREI